jgi:multidrug efflux pump subunit AcrB
MKVVYPYDTTPFVKISINEVVKTLMEAILLVFLVMYLFLQNFRATLIPTIAVPVVLLGTFAILAAFGFSINTLTMFGMVLAIGLLVDDAIVVVENVERVMSEEGLSPKEATRKSMGQIQGALVGIAMVLSAVFVPMAFFGGSTGADLSSVLDHHRFRDGPVGSGSDDPDTGTLRHHAQTGCRKAIMGLKQASSAGLTACSKRAPTTTPTA